MPLGHAFRKIRAPHPKNNVMDLNNVMNVGIQNKRGGDKTCKHQIEHLKMQCCVSVTLELMLHLTLYTRSLSSWNYAMLYLFIVYLIFYQQMSNWLLGHLVY
jgi:hypothetical protein